jgi:DNA topoisomerase-2
VNSIATLKGGHHVNVVLEQVLKKLETVTNKKVMRGSPKVKPSDIKNHCWLFIKSQIENPEFDSQTKENLTLVRSEHGSRPVISDKFIRDIETSGIIEQLQSFMNFKEHEATLKLGGRKSKIVRIPKLDDAIKAGTAESKRCTLIITEGDSAKSSALAGVTSLLNAKKYYGIYPLRGKMVNARDLAVKARVGIFEY